VNWIGAAEGAGCGAPFHLELAGRVDEGERVGIVITAWQCGHFPFFPAFAAGTRSVFWQLPHTNWMGLPLAACPLGCLGAGCLGAGCLADDCGVDALLPVGAESAFGAIDVIGICTLVAQCGQRPFRPAVGSGVRISLPQPGQ